MRESGGILRYLVLGANGFLGSHLLKTLIESGHQVVAYDQHEGPSSGFADEQLRWVQGDFCQEDDWQTILSEVDVCFHLISTTVPKTSTDDPALDVSQNLVGTIRLLEAARGAQVKFVFVSSGGTVYGKVQTRLVDETHPTDPLCSYGICKLAIEKYFQLYRHLYQTDGIILRIANPYGEWQSPDAVQGVIAVFLGRILRNQPIEIWGDGEVIRDYIYVQDVVSGMIAASNYSGEETMFNLGSGSGINLKQLLNKIEEVAGTQGEVTFHQGRAFDVPRNVLNIERARKELNWAPKVTLEEGLQKTVVWMKTNFIDRSAEG